jgi:translation initiation factor 2 subunit 2
MKSYLEMLEEAYELLKNKVTTTSARDQLEIPLPRINYQKNWTIILNAREFSSVFNRDLNLLAKFLQVEFNSPTRVEGNAIVILKKVSLESVKNKMERFAREFVICPVCGKPDTVLEKRDRILYIKCMACGAESPVLYKL